VKLVASILLLPLLFLSHTLALLSPATIGSLGRRLGALLQATGFRGKVVTGNLELALGEELSRGGLAALNERVYRHIGTLFLEIARNFGMTGEQRRRELYLSPEDAARIRRTLAPGKGAVFITGHIANWELFATGMAAWGFPVSIVAKRMNNAVSQALIERQRHSTQIEIIYSGGALEQMQEHLKRGRAIGFMVDQNTTGSKGIRANFFRVPASSIRGLAKLVRETGTAVVPICAFRLADGCHEVRLLDPLPFLQAPHLPEGSPERLAREEWLNTQQYQAALEQLIRLHPEQWMWIHRRWKASRAALNPETAHLENMAR
jgi:KDO2-lipid IV(A) lauroyltransferase